MSAWSRVAAGSVLLALAPATASAQSVPLTTLEAAYVVLGAQGAVARTVHKNAKACPSLTLDGTAQPMSIRMAPQTGKNAAFPVLVCELPIPSGTTSALLGQRALPLPPATLASVAVIGDTGCRLKGGSHGGQFQDCDIASKWPFSALAASVAEKKPNVVVHVGDYLYRESPCPKGDSGCKGSPYGDNWPTWKADFFKPAEKLLMKAPWIAVRGNHEDCARAGDGFMLFLDPALAQNQKAPACPDLIPQFSVTVAGQSFVVLDSSNAADNCAPGACNTAYAQQFAAMTPGSNAWLVTHRPVWAFVNTSSPINATLQAALTQWQGKLPPGITLAISGHIHLWEVLSFADQRSPQFVIGNSATQLDRKIQGSLIGLPIGGTTVSYGNSYDKWGFTIFTPKGGPGNWTATSYNVNGNSVFSCSVTPTAVSCP